MARAARFLPCVLVLLFGHACTEDPLLLLRLRTDLVAEADYGEARVVVTGVGEGVAGVVLPLTRQVRRAEGREVALGEVGPLPVGAYSVVVELWTEFGSRVAVNQVLVEVQGLTVVTVPITASCVGLTCPGRGDALDATFCLGGRCVPEACLDNRMAPGCPAAQCAEDAECNSLVACAPARCVEGVCEIVPDDELCMSDEICSARLGCLPIGPGGGCTPGSCDDFNPCTDDVCAEGGCEFTPNTAACDDGVFCNGADRCALGRCDESEGDPCSGLGACEEAERSCGPGSCGADERVESGRCVPCRAGTQNGPGDDPAGPDTACTAILCAANQRVLSNACFPCPAGATNAPGDDASGPDTDCVVNACEVDHRVLSNMCAPCSAGEANPAGDDPTGPDTDCRPVSCEEDHRVQANACVACPEGETNDAGDLASGSDTVCDCNETIRSDTFEPNAQWYARANGFDSGGGPTLSGVDFYRNTAPARVSLPIGGTTQLVLNEFLNNLYWREFSRPVESVGLAFWRGQYEAGGNFGGIRAAVIAGAIEERTVRVEQACGTVITHECSVQTRSDTAAPFARCTLGRIYSRTDGGQGAAPHSATEYYVGTVMPSRPARDTTYGTLNDFIDGFYRTEWGRPVDCAGLAYWTGVYIDNPSWDFARLRSEVLASGAASELVPCAEVTTSCVDFTLDTCGGPL